MAGPLTGIRVLDLSRVLAGPFCTMILCDLGAEVIKVERPEIGDIARGNGPFIDGISSYFFSINRGKKSLTLDLASPRGKSIFLQLVKHFDILVENFVPGTMEKLGLSYPKVADVNPRIIYASCSGYGQTGPYAHKPAFDVVVQGMGGIMSITGEPGGPPIRPGISIGDIAAGLFTAIGILAALHERSMSGKGQIIDVGMLDCQVAIQENAFARYFATGEVPGPLGTRHPVTTPFQAFETKDGYIVVALVGGERNQWALFCSALGCIDLIDDPRFQTSWDRTVHYDELIPILTRAFKGKTTEEWVGELEEVNVPCGPVNTIDKVAQDPQVLVRNMIVEIPYPQVGEVKVTNTPIKLSRSQCQVSKPAPELGEHAQEVLRNLLGLTQQEIEGLRKDRVI